MCLELKHNVMLYSVEVGPLQRILFVNVIIASFAALGSNYVTSQMDYITAR